MVSDETALTIILTVDVVHHYQSCLPLYTPILPLPDSILVTPSISSAIVIITRFYFSITTLI